MEIKNGQKLCLKKLNGRSTIEITRHKDPIMDNILIINSIGSTKYEDTWIIEKDLERWISSFKSEGFTEIKIIEDVESIKKTKDKKK
jgi:hypothetical protein